MMERNELSSYEKTRRKLKCILLSEEASLKKLQTMTFWEREKKKNLQRHLPGLLGEV